MARKRGESRGANRQASYERPRGTNTFGALRDEHEFGNMNHHLAERFSGARLVPNDERPDPEIIPLSTPSRGNEDIPKYFDDAQKSVVNAGPWINKPEIPTASEILQSSSGPSGFTDGEKIIDVDEELRPNKVEGAYASNDEYLGTQYDLLREDALRPLRLAVEEVRKDPWRDESDYPPSSGIGIYEPVYLKEVVFSFRGLSAKMAFSLNRVKKQVRWRQSKRLITGTLVAMTPADDAFQDPSKCIFATVGARPLSGLEINNPPEIDLFFPHPEQFDWDWSRKWIMVESRTSFFEASRHTLLALQHMMREPFPLSKYIVKAQNKVEPPEYIRLHPHTDLSSLVSIDEAERFQDVNILQNWPTGDSMTLDTSQSRALNRMMTKKLAVVQGPPGTGKTHVSVVALKTMLANMRRGDPPIIVTCQTNHALDQLLRHVAEFEPSFVRLGGQTKDQDKIKKRTLYEVRSTYEKPKTTRSRKMQAIAAMRKLLAEMQLLLAPFVRGQQQPLDHRLLVQLGLVTENQAASLETDALMGISQTTPGIQIEQWLGRMLVAFSHPYMPDDFGMPYCDDDFDETEQLEELEAEAVNRDDDDDIEALKGPSVALSDNFRGSMGREHRSDEDIRHILDSTEDLMTIPVYDRGPIYNYLLREAKKRVLGDFRTHAKEYVKQVHLKKVGQWEEDQRILLDQRVIGMTTTGLSKYRALISSLRPRVVMIEEAAETLEAPVTAACFPTLEHLILVGDHLQLRPHCNVHALENEPYNFNLSLFERLVRNNVELDTLRRQRRMVPEIRRLLYPIYGDTLRDHPSVKTQDNRPDVEGMGGVNSFFFTHEWPESRDTNQSAKNEKEADMIVGFFDYLVLNGVDPGKITVLTFYNGQRKLLTGKLRQHPNLRGQAAKVVTVDSYQGEENDVVLLSLVRSSKDGNIGFLSVDNRVCVALSRARRGFYLFGNAEKLVCASDTWEAVVKIVWGHGNKKDIPTKEPPTRIGFQLPLTCSKHGNKVFIEKPSDWEPISGGCAEDCGCVLPCGHVCRLRCHPFDNTRINCIQNCDRPCPTCGHACSALCSDPCRCANCDRRSKGPKAMVKPMNQTNRTIQQMPLSKASFNPAPSVPSAAPAVPQTAPVNSGDTHKDWQAYANGGVRADDTQVRQKQQAEAAKFSELISTGSGSVSSNPASGKLIQISPKKKITAGPSANTALLVDLDGNTPKPNAVAPSPNGRVSYKETFSYVGDITSPINSNNGKENAGPAVDSASTPAPPPAFNLLD